MVGAGDDEGAGPAVAGAAAGVVVAVIWRVPCWLACVFRIIVAAPSRRASGAPLISFSYEKIEIDY